MEHEKENHKTPREPIQLPDANGIKMLNVGQFEPARW
jgi:hypothetical protein